MVSPWIPRKQEPVRQTIIKQSEHNKVKFYPYIKCKWKACKKAGYKFFKSITFVQNWHRFYPLVFLLTIWKDMGILGVIALNFSWKLYNSTTLVFSILQMNFS